MVGYEHPEVAGTLFNIANVYKDHGKYEETLDLYRKAENVFLAVSGFEHPDVATSKHNLGVLFEQYGEKS